MNYIDFWNQAQVDPIGRTLVDFIARVIADGGTVINKALRRRLNTVLPFTDKKLVFTPNAYKPSKLYSFIPTDGSGDFSFTRATTATIFNTSGMLESVPANMPRICYFSDLEPRLVVEPQLTNYFLGNNGTGGYSIDTAGIGLGTAIPDYFGTGIFGIPVELKTYTASGSSGYRIKGLDTRNRYNTICMLVAQPSWDFFQLTITSAGNGAIFKFSTLEILLANTDTKATIKKVREGVYLLTVHCLRTTGLQFDQIRIGFPETFTHFGGARVCVAGTFISGIPSWFAQSSASANEMIPFAMPYVCGLSATTKNADVATVTTPAGVSEITETWDGVNTSTSTIPGTYTIPAKGLVDKIVMI